MSILDEARKLRAAMTAAAHALDDATASTAPKMFHRLKANGELVKSGTRINWNGTLKRAAVDLWDTEANNPDNAPTLWEDIAYRDGFRVIPQTITAGTAFALDEFGWWGDTLYRSAISNNVWTPEQYPAGWKAVTE